MSGEANLCQQTQQLPLARDSSNPVSSGPTAMSSVHPSLSVNDIYNCSVPVHLTDARTSENNHLRQASTRQSLADIRRRKNREGMQRSRQKQGEDIAHMRGELHALEAHYHQLVESKLVNQLVQEYHELATMSKQIMVENFALTKRIDRCQLSFARFQLVIDDCIAESCKEEPMPGSLRTVLLCAEFHHLPITMDEAQRSLSYLDETFPELFRSSPSIKQTLNEETRNCCVTTHANTSLFSHNTAQADRPQEILSWTVRHSRQSNGFVFVHLSKSVVGRTAAELLRLSWSMSAFIQPARVSRHEILQKLAPNFVVVGTEYQRLASAEPQRRKYLKFHRNTKNGMEVGCVEFHSNPGQVVQQDDTDKISAWFEFVPLQSPQRDQRCDVNFFYLVRLPSQWTADENNRGRVILALVDASSVVLHWEKFL